MNPPLTPLDVDMYKELRADIRETNQAVERVHEALDQHIRDEMKQYAVVQAKLARLETRWGILASFAAAVGAAFMAVVNKFFFQ